MSKNRTGNTMRRERRKAMRNGVKSNPAPLVEVEPDKGGVYRAAPRDGERAFCSEEERQRYLDETRHHRMEIDVDGVHDLDERKSELGSEPVHQKETGYRSRCRMVCRDSRANAVRRLVNRVYRWLSGCDSAYEVMPEQFRMRVEVCNRLILSKVATRCMALTKDPKRQRYFLHEVPAYLMGRQSILHFQPKRLRWLHRYGWYATMDATPPYQVNADYGKHPKDEVVRYRLVEEITRDKIKDNAKGEVLSYRLELVG